MKIRKDLGPQAIVLSTKRIKRGNSSVIEALAARDHDYITTEIQGTEKCEKGKLDVYSTIKSEMDELKSLIMDVRNGNDIYKELTELKEAFNVMFDLLSVKKNDFVFEGLSKVYYHLIATGISKQKALKLIKKLKDDCLPEDLKDHNYALRNLESIVKKSISASYKDTGKKRLSMFVGPAGEGKTTTLAKLAAHYLFGEKLDVGIITMDTYRIGAVEQLKTYTDIMRIPLEVISEKESLARALDKFGGRDMILIDTPGKSCKDNDYLLKLREFFAGVHSLESNLVLSTTSTRDHMIDAANKFSIVDYDNIIFTKLDDAVNVGSIYDVIDHIDKPVSFITNGQNVPQDIQKVDPGTLARLIIGNRMN